MDSCDVGQSADILSVNLQLLGVLLDLFRLLLQLLCVLLDSSMQFLRAGVQRLRRLKQKFQPLVEGHVLFSHEYAVRRRNAVNVSSVSN